MCKSKVASMRSARVAVNCVVAIAVIVVGAATVLAIRGRGKTRTVSQTGNPRATVYHHKSAVVYLPAPRTMLSDPGKGVAPHLLVRELFRQALLMAAREEVGLHTRDAVLEEAPPADQPDAALRCDVSFVTGNTFTVTAGELGGQNGPPDNSQFAFEGELQAMRIPPLVEAAEQYSRNTCAELLRSDGFAAAKQHQPPATRPSDSDLQSAEAQLDELTEASQFAAVRAAHEALRSGANGEWASMLVRGYANLAQLTWPCWGPTHEVLAARSLLYAQRMVVRDPKSPEAHWARAYARALVGLHGAALEDLAEADRLARETGAKPRGWAALIEPLCHYQTARLVDLATADARQAPLAMFLCFLTVEHCGSRADVIETAKAALKVNPLCTRLIEAMCEMSGVGYLHVLTEMGPDVYRGSLPGQLQRFADLPADARMAIKALRADPQNVPANADLVRSLTSDTHDVEPSWGVLGGIIRQTHFMQVCRRAYFMSSQWSVDASDYVNSQAPLIAGHAYQPLVDYYAAMHGELAAKQAAGRRLIAAGYPDVRLPAWRLYFAVDSILGRQHPTTRLLWLNLQQGSDPGAYDQEILMFPFQLDSLGLNKPMTMAHVARLRGISPFCPLWMAASVMADWDDARSHVDEWRRLAPGYPILSAALGRRYAGAGDYANAVDCLREFLRVAKDGWAYRMLADCYAHLGDEANWLRVMNESLLQEDHGLEHALTQLDMARHYMDTGDYESALPHALAAAETYSEWGLNSAAECYEGLKDWDHAEQYTAASATRYNHPDQWYFWCKRTGHGQVDRATAAMRQYVDSLADSAEYDDRWRVPAFYLLERDNAAAQRELSRDFDQFSDPWAGLHLALLKLRAGDRAAADKVIATTADRGAGFRAKGSSVPWRAMVDFTMIVRQRMTGGAGAKIDLAALDHLIDACDNGDRASLNYFADGYLEALDHSPQAGIYLRRCAAAGYHDNVNCLLALQELRRAGIDPFDRAANPATTAPAVAR